MRIAATISRVGCAPLADTQPASLRDRRLLAGLLGFAILAFALRFATLAFGGGLDGKVGLDDGTYFAGALAFVNGRLPYRDFNILHPPGILYVLAPFGVIANATNEPSGLILARLAFMTFGAVNTFLVGLVGARVGKGTALWAAAIYAVWVVPLMGERSTFLIAPQVTAMLIALLALTNRAPDELTTRRVVVAGVAIGVTGAFQIWAVIPATVILAWLVLRTRGRIRDALRVGAAYVLSGAVTAMLLLGPFLLLAGPRMIEMILFAQASRAGRYVTYPVARLRQLEGLTHGPLGVHVPTVAILALAVAVAALVLLVAVRRPPVRLWAAVAVSELAFIMIMPLFIWHYGGWPAPVIALCLGAAIACVIEGVPASRRTLMAVAWVLAIVVLATVGLRPAGNRPRLGPDLPVLASARCVIADEGYYAIRTETLIRTIRNGCRVLPNPRSISHINNAESGGDSRRRQDQDEYQAKSIEYFTSADVVLFSQLARDGLTEDTLAAIRAAFDREETVGGVLVLSREGQ